MSPIRFCLPIALAAWFSPQAAAGQGWQLVKEAAGIRIFTRAVPGAEIRQLRAETRMRATVKDLLEAYLDVDRHLGWYPGCVAARLVRRDEAGRPTFYHRIANPWPVKDRDYAFAIDTAAAEEPGGILARYRDVPGLVPATRGCVRMRKLEGYWKFVPEPDGFTAVTYVFDFDPGPGAPASFINMSLPRIGDNMLKGLARGAEIAGHGRIGRERGKRAMNDFYRIESISKIHDLLGLEKPRHPLITLIEAAELKAVTLPEFGDKVRNELYLVSLKNGSECKFIYGRQSYDFQEGTVVFLAPGQVVTASSEAPAPGGDTELGWMLFFHPSLVRGTRLGKRMREYSFFSYQSHEALHVSGQERTELSALLGLIKREYGRNSDAFSTEIILSNLELLFAYFQRYYGRQFITRASANRDVLARFEEVLDLCLSGEPRSLPTVKGCAERIGYSPDYLSDLLRKETGKSAQEHIHDRLIDRAKDLLLGTQDPVNRVAYALGFAYPQHFSKLFKNLTGRTPGEFRSDSAV